jgi:hypothetical protein
MSSKAPLFKRLIGLIAVGLLASCSSGGDIKVLASASGQKLPAQPSLRLVVNAVAPDSTDVLSDVRAAVLSQLEATGHYSRVTATTADATDLVMTVNIVKYAKVTVGERILVGVFAGRNRVGADITLVETADNVTIKKVQADGESAAEPISSESGISDAVREFAKQVASASI